MQLLSQVFIGLCATFVSAAPLYENNEFIFQAVHPIDPEFSVKVPSQLFIGMCQNVGFGKPCDGGYIAPGLCYYPPFAGVSAVWPAPDVSGCTLYSSSNCTESESEPDLLDVAYPGIANLVTKGFNDMTNSFICY